MVVIVIATAHKFRRRWGWFPPQLPRAVPCALCLCLVRRWDKQYLDISRSVALGTLLRGQGDVLGVSPWQTILQSFLCTHFFTCSCLYIYSSLDAILTMAFHFTQNWSSYCGLQVCPVYPSTICVFLTCAAVLAI